MPLRREFYEPCLWCFPFDVENLCGLMQDVSGFLIQKEHDVATKPGARLTEMHNGTWPWFRFDYNTKITVDGCKDEGTKYQSVGTWNCRNVYLTK